jgi:hypothetical protein
VLVDLLAIEDPSRTKHFGRHSILTSIEADLAFGVERGKATTHRPNTA